MERACIDLLVVCQEKSFATTLTYIRYLLCIYKRTSMLYKIRQTSAFVPLSILTTGLAQGVGQPYTDTVRAIGGIPFYNWAVDSGPLPDGLSFNSFTGEISGTPSASGTFSFTVRVRDYVEGGAGVTVPLSITIN